MFYQKPKNLKYTDMCIYVDEHAYDENKSNEMRETIYKYIYFISLMLAHKMKLFGNHKYYDDFALWYTGQIWSRLENPKQFQYDEDGNPKLARITSILNYIKSTISARKITYEQQEYSQVIYHDTEDNFYNPDYTLSDKINEGLDNLYSAEFDLCLKNCGKSIRKFLQRIPYKENTDTFYNIYLSCLLTFLNSITLPNKEICRINNLKFQNSINILTLYDKENENPVILYHLDESMRDYIYVLFKELKHEIAMELSRTNHQYLGTNSGIYTLMMQELNGYTNDDYGDSD